MKKIYQTISIERLLLHALFLLMGVVGWKAQVYGQSMSGLHQVLASNSLIDRPQVFRDLQTNIEDTLKTVQPGVKLDYLYGKIDGIRPRILANLQIGFDIEETSLSDGYTIKINFKDKIIWSEKLTNNIKYKAFDSLLDTMEVELEDFLFSKLDSTETDLKKINDAVSASLIFSIYETGLLAGKVNLTDDYAKDLAKVLAKFVFEEVRKRIRLKYPNFSLEDEIEMTEWANKIDAVLNEAVEKIRAKVANVLDQAEYKLAKAVDSFSQWLVSGNAGLAIVDGDGAFGGGVHVAFTFDSKCQVGVYYNGQFSEDKFLAEAQANAEKAGNNKLQAISTRQSLIGGQLRFASDCSQLDIMGAVLLKANRACELGVGVSRRLEGGLIIGLSGFIIVRGNEAQSRKVYGGTLKRASISGPTLFAGFIKEDDKRHPIFQVSFPIPAKK